METYVSKKRIRARKAVREEMIETKYGWRNVRPGFMITYDERNQDVADEILSKEKFENEYQRVSE